MIRLLFTLRKQQRDFADASHSKSAKSVTTTVSYDIFSSENSYPCTVTIRSCCTSVRSKSIDWKMKK